MFKWLNNILGNKPKIATEKNENTVIETENFSRDIERLNAIEIPSDIDPEWLTALKKYLEPLIEFLGDQAQDGLIPELFNFVLTGENESILNEVSGERKFYEFMLDIFNGRKKYYLSYKGFMQLPVQVTLNWIRVLDAVIKNYSYGYYIPFPNGIHWPEVLLNHAIGDRFSRDIKQIDDFTIEFFETLLVKLGESPSMVIISSFAMPDEQHSVISNALFLISKLPDYADKVNSNAQSIKQLLLPSVIHQKVHVIRMLEPLPVNILNHFAEEIVELAVVTSRQVRSCAEPLVNRCGLSVLKNLKEMASNGNAEQRGHACKLIWNIGRDSSDESIKEFLLERDRVESSAKVISLINELMQSETPVVLNESTLKYDLPVVNWACSMDFSFKRVLDRLWNEIDKSIAEINKKVMKHNEEIAKMGHAEKIPLMASYSEKLKESFFNYITSERVQLSENETFPDKNKNSFSTIIGQIVMDTNVNSVAMIKILNFFDWLSGSRYGLYYRTVESINNKYTISHVPSLIELQVLLDGIGCDGASCIINSYCLDRSNDFAKEWDKGDVWPFFAHNIELVIKKLMETQASQDSFDRGSLFRAISLLPVIPAKLSELLFSFAFGSAKSDRLYAQSALENYSDKEVKIINALSGRNAEVRMYAAQWLGRLKLKDVITELENAAIKEKNDAAKAAMIDALQVMGQTVEKYLDRNKLLKEAITAAEKEIPEELNWFTFDSIPKVRWDDSGEIVPSEILRLFVLQSVKIKNPEPNALLKKYCLMFNARDRENLGQFILETWIHEDIRPVSSDEAMKLAEAEIQLIQNYQSRYYQYYTNGMLNTPVDKLKYSLLLKFSNQPAGSQIGTKGLLALAAACAGPGAAKVVSKYLKEYYGTRAAQGKSLIQMLAWIDHPTAIQMLLSIGNRFRTKGIQDEAAKQAEAVAERKGWTLTELADRTIPYGGFDENRMIELNYGSRIFKAKLNNDLKVTFYNQEGKEISSLPEPRIDDNPELAADAKKIVSNAKKEIKTAIEILKKRLYEEMCREREWMFEDWNSYMNQHPVSHLLVQQLIWVQMDEKRIVNSFRPLDDGTLTDCKDNEVVLTNDIKIRLAHGTSLSEKERNKWMQHFIDYKVTPLFQQLGNGAYGLSGAEKKANIIEEFKGYKLDSFTLQKKALKLGYTLGPFNEEYGGYITYEKYFMSIGLASVIQFSGDYVSGENRPQRLENLSFRKVYKGDADMDGIIPLSRVPEILLSECYNDFNQLANEGEQS
jgi:hypothetical protein